MSPRAMLIAGAALAGTGVALGAFGAHGLKDLVTPERLVTFETGVRYQMYHALALLILGAVAERHPNRFLNRAGYAFLLGVLVFSGSLYALVLTDTPFLGAITPIGGVGFLLGWGLCLLAFIRRD